MKGSLILFMLSLSFNLLVSQSFPIIPSESAVAVGAYYYPEHWPEEQWERDIMKIAELGFEFTHFAEFAWARMEPEEGKFDFSWLDKCVDLAGKYGLKVIMCTPTPTPPAWLTHNYPEVLIVTEEGRRLRHGTRLHVSQTHPVYQKFSERIITKMAQRYGDNPVVVGWQLDNEPHYRGLHDYSDHAQAEFKNWLKVKYGNIDNLNKAWGASFWSMTYNNFEQIRIPNSEETQTLNPHTKLDFDRFTADELAEFLRFQAETLRPLISGRQWITTNYAYFKFLPVVDPYRNRKDLDFASHTMYLLSTALEYPDGEMAFRLGSGLELAFSADFARGVNGRTGIMELQPGQINWGSYNAQPLPGAVRMWVWHSYGLGDEFICTYRFRQPLFGGEMYHKGIMETDGTTLAPGGKEYASAIEEFNNLTAFTEKRAQLPEERQKSRTAFLWNFDNIFDQTNIPHNQNWNVWDHNYTYFAALKSLGVEIDFITEEDEFNPQKYPFMVAPAYQLVDKKLVNRWREYVEGGGRLVLSCRTAQKDRNGQLWEALLQEPVYDLIGGKIEYNDQLPPGVSSSVSFRDVSYNWDTWGEILEPEEAEIISRHEDNFYEGKAAVIRNRIGKGSVTYIGVNSADRKLEKEILRDLYSGNGSEVLDLPWYVFVEWRDGIFVGVNYSSENYELPVNEERFILGKKILKPGEVSVWK